MAKRVYQPHITSQTNFKYRESRRIKNTDAYRLLEKLGNSSYVMMNSGFWDFPEGGNLEWKRVELLYGKDLEEWVLLRTNLPDHGINSASNRMSDSEMLNTILVREYKLFEDYSEYESYLMLEELAK